MRCIPPQVNEIPPQKTGVTGALSTTGGTDKKGMTF